MIKSNANIRINTGSGPKKLNMRAMVITNNSKRTISKPGLFQGRTRRYKLQKNSVKSPIQVKLFYYVL
jgi:hypothetical protein